MGSPTEKIKLNVENQWKEGDWNFQPNFGNRKICRRGERRLKKPRQNISADLIREQGKEKRRRNKGEQLREEKTGKKRLPDTYRSFSVPAQPSAGKEMNLKWPLPGGIQERRLSSISQILSQMKKSSTTINNIGRTTRCLKFMIHKFHQMEHLKFVPHYGESYSMFTHGCAFLSNRNATDNRCIIAYVI